LHQHGGAAYPLAAAGRVLKLHAEEHLDEAAPNESVTAAT
jgi:hypothetical protein